MTTPSLITISLAGCRLRVDFLWKVDRYVQTVVLVDEANPDRRELPIMTSVEGDSEQVWPASPPLQDLNFHTLPTGRLAALAVGMAGNSHWSLAWESAVDPVGLVCDVACRIKQSPGYLASTWKLAAGVSMPNEGELRIQVTDIGLHIDTEPNDEFAANSEHADGRLCLFPNRTETTPPRTVRWRYRISIVEVRDHGTVESSK